MSTKAKVILVAVIVAIAFVALNGPEYVNKTLNPVGYWTEKRDKYQKMVSFYEDELSSCLLDLEKLKRTRNITIPQSILAGSTPEEAVDEFIADWEATTKTCSLLSDLIAKGETKLEKANRELAKHK